MNFWQSDNGLIKLHCADCLPAMKAMKDKAFNLAVVDIPYGIESQISKGGGSHTKSSVKFHQLYSENGKTWDKAVAPEYFHSLQRVSGNQIIFGANYYNMPACRGFVVWDKPEMRIHTMSECEYAWTSFDCPARIVPISRATRGLPISPTQKPVALYHWLLTNYAKPGQTILDTHHGSGSLSIACWDMGYSLEAWEIDQEYFDAAVKRIENHIKQGRLFK